MYQQLALLDELIEEEPRTVLELLSEHLHFEEIVPRTFARAFYQDTGRDHDHQLMSYLYALLFQKLFSVPTDTVLLKFLNISAELRAFCGIKGKVFDKTLLSRFKSTFHAHIEDLFNVMVEITEPMCKALSPYLSEILSIDTTGGEPYVKENNDKVYQALFKKYQAFFKNSGNDSKTDAFLAAWAEMPKAAPSNPDARLQYINGHFCYAFKEAIITNGLGIIRHMEFLTESPVLSPVPDETPKTPAEEKSISDCKAFIPTLATLSPMY